MTTSQLTELRGTDRQRVSDRVLEAIAQAEATSPLEFERRLWDVIDPDALDAIVRPGLDGFVEFQYLGYTVVVHGDGRVTLRDREGAQTTDVGERDLDVE